MMKRILYVLFLLGLLSSLSGCVVLLHGAGEAGLGYSSTSRIFTYHEVDGDKEGKESKSELQTDLVSSVVGKAKDAQPDAPVAPDSGE